MRPDEPPGRMVYARGALGPQIGNNVQHNKFVLPEVVVTWPSRVGAIPPLADCYQDRDEARRLAEIMDGAGTACSPRCCPA